MEMESSEKSDTVHIEVPINADVNCQQAQCSISHPTSPKKHAKRKCQSGLFHDGTPKKSRVSDSVVESSNFESSDVLKVQTKKRKGSSVPRKHKAAIDPDELKNVLEGMDEEIDVVLEETAQKNKLTATNVKNILRHVITNEYVLAMVRNTMKTESNECDDLEEIPFEPKLTRSKVKELREKQQVLPWPVPSSVKQPSLLEEVFSDESSDEDFVPNEEECFSEEDNLTMSPKSADLDFSMSEKPASPMAKSNAEDVDDDSALVIALPEQEPASANTEVDKIALRTRSKLPLNDTPLKVIEDSFVAPDITVDMYDTHCDDEEWQTFLRELSSSIDPVVAVEKPDEEPDDPEDDPEFVFFEEDDIPDELDLRYDNTVKVTRKELNELMAETMLDAESQLDVNGCDDEEDEDLETPSRVETPQPSQVDDFVENVRTQWMNSEERIQLDQQMRIYVQLLTQSYLLSFGVPELNFINVSSKLLMDEIKMFATNQSTVNERSAFYAHNLDDGLKVINEYESSRSHINIKYNKKTRKGLPGITSPHIKKTLFNSKVFIYPELLPICSFHRNYEYKKAVFTAAEDNLIALGLDQFSFAESPVAYIHSLLLPTKSEYQIKLRIKNSKSPKVTLDNPIKYYFTYKCAPPFLRIVRDFDPNNVKAPRDYPPNMLPRWMANMFDPVLNPPKIIPILPKKDTSGASTLKPIVSMCPKRTKLIINKQRKQRLLIPRNVHFSPLKQISPILKKYNQKRHILPSSANNKNSKTRKSVRFAKKLVLKSTVKVESELEDTVNESMLDNNIHVSDVENAASTSSVCNPIDSANCDTGSSAKAKSDTIATSSSRKSSETESNHKQLLNSEATVSECVSYGNSGENYVLIESVVDVEEEVDDEPDSANQQDPTLTSNTNSKKQPASKKKVKQQRDLESSLALLQPNLLESDPKKEERETLFANSYLLRVTETLKGDPETLEKFLKTLCKYQHTAKSPTKLYLEVKEILKEYPALVDDFVAFLRPEQAKDCGKYKEYVTLSKIRQFLRKIEVHFKNQPQHLLKILKVFAQFRQQSSITSADVLATLQPLLKNQSHLMEELSSLLPDVAPPEQLMTDFEDITIPNSDDDNSSVDSCEEITIPDTPDPYGGKDCPCECHISSTEVKKAVNKIRHCVKCGIKFIDGKIYIQTGKVLKPAQVIYHEAIPEPPKIQNNDPKVITKSKHSTCPANAKSAVVTDQPPKPEATHTKKDPVKTAPIIQQPLIPTEDPVPSTSKLPFDVNEDTVFPTVSSCSNNKSVPSDFSQLKDIIGHTKNKGSSPDGKSTSNGTSTDAANSSEQSGSQASNKWTRDEDKVIIYNCQRFGITERSFQTSASLLKARSQEEVQDRFMHLMNLLSKEMKL